MFARICLLLVMLLAAATAARAQTSPQLHRFEGAAVSPDGRTVATIEFTEAVPDAVAAPSRHLVLRSTAGGAAVNVPCPAAAGCTPSSPVWSPDGTRLAFLVRERATRAFGVWTVDANGTHPRARLRSFTGELAAPRWSRDGAALAVLATAGAHKELGATAAGAALTGEISATLAQDVERIATVGADGKLRYASPADLFVYEYDWLPDERGFVATAAHGNGDNNWWIAKLYRIDRAARTARMLAAPALQIDAPRVSPDGRTVAFIGGLMSDFGSVGGDIYTLALTAPGGEPVDVTPGLAASADGIAWNGSNRRITFTGLAGDAALLADVDTATHTVRRRWSAAESIGAGGGLDVSFAHDGTTSAVVRQTFERPPELYAGAAGAWHPLTHANAGLAPVVRARSVSWVNDGFHVQGWLLAPRSVRAAKRYPMLVQIHGGPSAAARPAFVGRGDIKDAIGRGYFVFLPNPRGSYGQGERFTAANVRDLGYGDLRDILAGVDAVERIAPIDDRRLGITGWSYGGYMTMWAVTQTHRFRAAVAGAGIANWQSYYGENGIDQWMIPFFGATVYADPAVYARSSPITFIRGARTPTLVVVGERDVECPAPQSLEFWHALSTLGVPSSLVIYAGEGHRISKPADRHDITRRSLDWFKRYIGT